MLTNLLSRHDCADCKECCVFSRYDIWEQPALNPQNRKKAEQLLPECRFVSKGQESSLFRISESYPDDLFLCPLLDTDTGCMLGEEKPFECQIYPFQITEINHRLAIILSPLCEVVIQKPLSVLLDFLKQELAEKLFTYAQQHPDVIRPYDYMSPVLLWNPENF